MSKCIGLLILLSLICGVSLAEELTHEDAIMLIFNNLLKDPESAKIDISEIKECSEVRNMGKKVVFEGYLVEVWVNSKNSFGGYTGKKLYQFLFHEKEGGKLYRIYNEDAEIDMFPVIRRFGKYSHTLHIEGEKKDE